jgi:hypothetical protein
MLMDRVDSGSLFDINGTETCGNGERFCGFLRVHHTEDMMRREVRIFKNIAKVLSTQK